MGRGTFLGYLSPLMKSSAPLGTVGWEVLGDLWHDIVSPESHRHCTVRGRGPKVS